MTKPTDDKRLVEIRERHAKRRMDIIFDGTMLADMNADIAFLLEKIAEYETRDGAAEQHACGKPAASFIPRWGMSWACVLPKGHTGECKRGGECFKHGHYIGDNCPQLPNCTAEAPVAAPPPQVREAEVERPSDADFKKHLDNLAEKWYAEHGSKVDQRISAAREEGVKAGLQAAADVIRNSPSLNRVEWKGLLVENHAQPCWCEICSYIRGNISEIESLPVTEIASRKD